MARKVKKDRTMSPRQCEIAAEAYAACLLAQAGYDVSVQYGANQPDYDLIAVKGEIKSLVSVKGSQDGGWMLAVKYKTSQNSYHDAIDLWYKNQRDDVTFILVQFFDVQFGQTPACYVARRDEIAEHLKGQAGGRGYGSLKWNVSRTRKSPKWKDRLPDEWQVSLARIEKILK